MKLSENITELSKSIFFYSNISKSLVIPEKVTVIRQEAFQGCKLKELFIYDKITEIEDGAFGYCPNLSDIYYSGTEEQWNQINIGALGNEYFDSAEKHFKHRVIQIGEYDDKYGTISIEQSWVPLGETVTVEVTPESSCKLVSVYVDGKTIEGNTFTVTDNHIVTAEFEVEDLEITSGQCGENAIWTLEDRDNDGNEETLIISGYGPIVPVINRDDSYDYDTGMESPWTDYKILIENVVIEEGITSIGDVMFAEFRNIKQVEIPQSMTSLGGYLYSVILLKK